MPHHHQPHKPEWIINEEKPKSLNEIADRLVSIGQKLKDNNQVVLGKHTVQPAPKCDWIMRYERTHHGELILKFELKWNENLQNHDKEEDFEIR
jgi:hypothetical protein